MIYDLCFDKKALREWESLDNSLKQQFKKKLEERMNHPRVVKDKLSGYNDVYKIKLRESGYRLAYLVDDEKKKITVLVIGKRNKSIVYEKLKNRGK